MPTVLITGANRGVGLALARQFLSNGFDVIGTAREPDKADELKAAGAKIMQLDVADPDSIAALKAGLGDTPLDYLINNAGIASSTGLGDLDYGEFEHVLRVNTLAPLRIIEALTDNVAAGDKKVIANLTSKMGSIDVTDAPSALIYRTSKAALNMALRTAARSLAGQGISVLTLHPGWVKTDMGGPNALVSPEDSAAGLYKVITGTAPATELRFFDYEGNVLPW
ncbi:MAG: SDR family oxidoreductase [Alphaproteobacteria bacterium]|nr:short-chain dehydrogenase [Hyphomonas sp.]MBR9806765.1 SDR family oxidoreductase [Alphaproteobacteria bacterium]|tara:strand:+ start:3125 stop:3796 length:672 start_codon:yes stop_codon:yes gene_type:complete